MATRRLTATVIERARVQDGDRLELWDSIETGLHLRCWRVQGRVERSWFVRYRVGARQPRLKLGVYSERSAFGSDFRPDAIEPGGDTPLTLAEARLVAKRMKTRLASGGDPQRERRERRRAAREAKGHTVAALAADFLEHQQQQGVKTWREQERQLEKDVLPVLGPKAVSDVTPQDIEGVVARIVKRAQRVQRGHKGQRQARSRGGAVQANRTRSLLVQLFSFALVNSSWRALVTSNPAQAAPKPLKREQPRERLLTDQELKQLWEAAEDLEAPIRAAFRFRILTGQRWEEIRGMRWEELRRERVAGPPSNALLWYLPESRTKAKRAHVLPLPHQAEAILEELRPSTGGSSFVFESPRKAGSPIARVNRSFRKWRTAAQVEDFEGVDLRRSFATGCARLGVRGEVVAALLNHAPQTITRQVYDRYELLPEKARALATWATHLERVIAGKAHEVGELVEFRQ